MVIGNFINIFSILRILGRILELCHVICDCVPTTIRYYSTVSICMIRSCACESIVYLHIICRFKIRIHCHYLIEMHRKYTNLKKKTKAVPHTYIETSWPRTRVKNLTPLTKRKRLTPLYVILIPHLPLNSELSQSL